MATRMQQRRGTAAQWISTNAGAGPVLNAGEIGWESDTNKFKIGDGVNNWTSLDYFADVDSTVNPAFGTSITFEGATADSYETILQVTDPTADRTITLPNATGTVITTGNLSDITNIGVFTSTITMEGATANDHELTISAGDPTADRTATFPDATGTIVLDTATQTLTNKTLTTPVISSITNGAATLTLPTSTGTIALTSDIAAGIVTESGTQTLTNKTLTSPVITGAVFNDGSIVFEGATANDHETTFTITDPTADRTITFPDATGTVALTANVAALTGATFTGAVSGTDLTLSGNLTVNGTTTTINSTTLAVDDKNITLGDVDTPSDVTADGGGITLKGATDKTFNWVDATDSWTSSEHINLASGKSYSMNGTALKDVSETLSNKTLASAVATTALTLNATAELRLADTDSSHYVGFKAPGTVSANKVWTLPAADGSAGQVLTTDGSGVFSFSTPSQGAAFSEFMLIGA
jgi:hypothetical protein